MSTIINNPNAALSSAPVTDYRTYRNADGVDLELGKGEVYTARAAATVLKGQALEHVVPTATIPHRVQPMQVATGIHLYAGAAMNSAAAGEQVQFCRRGFMIVFTDDSDTPAFGQVLLKPDATVGQFATAAAAASLQNVLGVVLSAEMDGVALRKSAAFLDANCGITNAAS